MFLSKFRPWNLGFVSSEEPEPPPTPRPPHPSPAQPPTPPPALPIPEKNKETDEGIDNDSKKNRHEFYTLGVQ